MWLRCGFPGNSLPSPGLSAFSPYHEWVWVRFGFSGGARRPGEPGECRANLFEIPPLSGIRLGAGSVGAGSVGAGSVGGGWRRPHASGSGGGLGYAAGSLGGWDVECGGFLRASRYIAGALALLYWRMEGLQRGSAGFCPGCSFPRRLSVAGSRGTAVRSFGLGLYDLAGAALIISTFPLKRGAGVSRYSGTSPSGTRSSGTRSSGTRSSGTRSSGTRSSGTGRSRTCGGPRWRWP